MLLPTSSGLLSMGLKLLTFVFSGVAAALLGVVLLGVKYLKPVFFLKASITEAGINGSVLFGPLAYCFELSNGTTCSGVSYMGYEFGQFLVSIKVDNKYHFLCFKKISIALSATIQSFKFLRKWLN